jgi:hypothetical protein
MTTISYDPNYVVQLENARKVYFTITDDDLNTYLWHGNVPALGDIQAYLDSIKDDILLLIRRREYPDTRFNTLGDVAIYLTDNPGVTPVPWVSTHPVKADIIDAEKIDPTVWTELDSIKGVSPEMDKVISVIENIFHHTIKSK